MRVLCEDRFHFALHDDEATGALYLEAVCNQSAAYFTITCQLLPAEAAHFGPPGARKVTAAGKALCGRLADEAQWSPAKFAASRDEAWRALGQPGAPEVPPLR